MVSMMNLVQFMILITILFCCQYQAAIISDDNHEMSDSDFNDNRHVVYPSEQDRIYHQLFQRASLRYHPHVLYKKASLKPIIGYNGKFIISERGSE
ncbi:unnamed protein product [Rotaria magnacalcarata]|uniref:Uncharacterized protein n=1 Tax=Rotaria magnacalcarata TaxID=392030 RepID=A0A814ZMP5_9BILA|nr:unnamed protein product [Rotaria magnacalcarata]CAF1453206.1 unnamed protein product [Rotaria magnacalcarata]CAF2150694.1 unnamed protein product [Rotaria magnacalcarata]CAF2153010.1 unnamed protein product [Rotaria magnacalcarata]CAF2190062.1 unnamed protein product [Rotaria magnacalcarata]